MLQPSLSLSVLLVYAAIPPLPHSTTQPEPNIPLAQQWQKASIANPRTNSETLLELEKICALEENWDGYGGLPIHPAIARTTKYALRIFSALNLDVDVIPNSNGTISFEWSNNRGEALLEIGKTRFAGFVRARGSGDIPLSGATEDLTGINNKLRDVVSIIKAALVPTETTSISSRTFKAEHVRSAA